MGVFNSGHTSVIFENDIQIESVDLGSVLPSSVESVILRRTCRWDNACDGFLGSILKVVG